MDWINDLNPLNDRQVLMRQQIEQLCNINSGTFHLDGIARVQAILVDWFAPLVATTQRYESAGQQTIDDQGRLIRQSLGPTLVFTKRPTVRPRLLLCIHCDTVYGEEHPFQTCRLQSPGVLNGPGVIDAKGGLVVMLHALQVLEESRWAARVGWQVAINADEEIGSPGSVGTLNELAQHADWGLLFEPTMPDGTMVSWRKGSGNFTIVARGQAAHAGRDFHRGRNAIAALCLCLTDIHRLNRPDDAQVGEVTFNVGRISGGGAVNVVPDLAIARVNVRVRTLAQQRWAEGQLQHVLDQHVTDGIQFELHGGFSSPPKVVDARTASLQRVVEECGEVLGIPVKWQGSGGASDGNKFAAAGLANIDTFGPCGGEIHSDREYLLLDSLVPRAKLAAAVMMQLAKAGCGEAVN